MRMIVVFLIAVFCPFLYADTNKMMGLDEAIKVGLMNNKELKWAKAETKTASKILRTKYRDFFPEVTLGYSISDSVEYFAPDTRIKQVSLGISQILYDKGKLKSELNISKKQLKLVELQNIMNQAEFVFSVIESYKDILKTEKELEITEKTLLSIKQQVDIARLEKYLGEMTESDFLELELAFADMEIKKHSSHAAYNEKIFNFNRLLSLRSDSFQVLKGEIDYFYEGFIPLTDEDFYKAEAVQKNLAVKEKLLGKQQAYDNYKIIKKNKIPDISLSCDFTFSGESFPLNEKGFSVFINMDFDTPVIPSSFKTGIGKKSENERTRTFSGENMLFENLENIYSQQSEKLTFEKAAWELDDNIVKNESEAVQLISKIKIIKESLATARKKTELENLKVEIDKLKAELGEIKRIDLVESEISLAESEILVFEYISELYSKEKELFLLCGMTDAVSTGKFIILESGL